MASKGTKTKAVVIAKHEDSVQDYKNALECFADVEPKKLIVEKMCEKIVGPDVIDVAIFQYKQTKDPFFLEKIVMSIEKILGNIRYETGVLSEVCSSIKGLYEDDEISEDLASWLKTLLAVVLRFAVIRNVNPFFEAITEISERHNIMFPDIYKALIKMYRDNDRAKLLIEFRKCKPLHEFSVPECCLYEGDDCCSCNIDSCKIYGKILYFSTAICLYKIWLDSTTWKYSEAVELRLEEHRDYCRYISEAFRILDRTDCINEAVDIELFREQYKLFRSVYMEM